MLPFILALDDLQCQDVALVGVKAAQLATLQQAGLPVPAGFVLPTHVCRIAPHGEITPDVEAAIAVAYGRLGEAVAVAVRVSTTLEQQSADVFDSFGGIVGVGKIVRQIEKCWQSATGERARAFYERTGTDAAAVEMAVLVQTLVATDESQSAPNADQQAARDTLSRQIAEIVGTGTQPQTVWDGVQWWII